MTYPFTPINQTCSPNDCVIFTNNAHKCSEIQALLENTSLSIHPYLTITKRHIDVIEDGVTFEQNALKKINALSQLSNCFKLADDSGLEIDALNGKPGVLSARYGGLSLTDDQRCDHVLRQLTQEKNRNAQFRCVIAMTFPDNTQHCVEGIARGHLALEKKGSTGFGYDPIFIPEGYEKTFAECGPKIKQRISHRSIALQKASEKIRNFLEQNPKPS